VTRLVLGVVPLLAVLVHGCGEDGPRDGGAAETTPAPRSAVETTPAPRPPPEATPAPRPAPETTPAPRPAPAMITESDSGDSVTLSAGSETRLQLSGDYVWSEPTVRGDAVELTPVDYLQDPGFSEWVILAVQPGTATIAADGTPACADEERCPAAPLPFMVQVTVVR